MPEIENPDEQEPQEPESETPTEAPDMTAEIEKWKALARKNEARAKDNSDKAKRLDELEESAKSEAEKLLARAEKAEQALQSREAKDAEAQLAADVGEEKGVPGAILRGSTREELEAHADELLEAFKQPKSSTTDGQGKVGEPISGPKQITSRDELKSLSAQEIEAARKDGRLDALMGKSA